METSKLVLANPQLRLVGLVDKDPRKIGRDMGFGARVGGSVEDCVRRTNPDIAFLMTASRFSEVIKDIRILTRMGVDVVSSCEELVFPWVADPSMAKKLNGFIRKRKRRVLGTGVNPGFVMDLLPLTLASVCQNIESIRVLRIVDVSKRRLPLQKKMAVGLSKTEFIRRLRQEKIGHAGLKESIALIASGIGLKLQIRETIRPIAVRNQVIGIAQTATGTLAGRKKMILELSMSWGAKDPRDEVHVVGTPPVHMKIRPGIQGDMATAACLVHAALKLDKAPYGLLTVKGLPAGIN